MYLQRVVPDCGMALAPIEEAITTTFLPALFGSEPGELTALREQFRLVVKSAGLGVPDPTMNATPNHRVSLAITEPLTESLVNGTPLNTVAYAHEAKEARTFFRDERDEENSTSFKALLDASGSAFLQKRLKRSKRTGTWLTLLPNRLNGTDLSATEFRDGIRLRFGLVPLALPHRCDGCQQRFTVDHAMSCKKGGLILLRHAELAQEWHTLCAQALTPTAVSDEPLISQGQHTPRRNEQGHTDPAPELRGDIAAHGFWSRGATAIFDVRVTDLENSSQRASTSKTVLARHEREKKAKYLELCERQRKHFTPLVFSVDGLMATECDAAIKRVASLISKKWRRTYSQVCGFVRSRLCIALVRCASRCLRWDRNPSFKTSRIPWDSGTGLRLYN